MELHGDVATLLRFCTDIACVHVMHIAQFRERDIRARGERPPPIAARRTGSTQRSRRPAAMPRRGRLCRQPPSSRRHAPANTRGEVPSAAPIQTQQMTVWNDGNGDLYLYKVCWVSYRPERADYLTRDVLEPAHAATHASWRSRTSRRGAAEGADREGAFRLDIQRSAAPSRPYNKHGYVGRFLGPDALTPVAVDLSGAPICVGLDDSQRAADSRSACGQFAEESGRGVLRRRATQGDPLPSKIRCLCAPNWLQCVLALSMHASVS